MAALEQAARGKTAPRTRMQLSPISRMDTLPPSGTPFPPTGEEKSARPSLRVLIADAYPDSAWTLAVALRLLGLETRAVNDGPEARLVAAEFQPDVLLTDLVLPGLDGCTLARCLREEGRGSGVLLVALTGYHDERHRAQAWAAGFDHYLIKPVCPAELHQLLLATRGKRGDRSF